MKRKSNKAAKISVWDEVLCVEYTDPKGEKASWCIPCVDAVGSDLLDNVNELKNELKKSGYTKE